MITEDQIKPFASLVETHQLGNLKLAGVDCEANRINSKTSIKIGKKFARVDVGSSGKYMVDLQTGEIFGIKAYGVVHRGHRFGTLDTIRDWYWGRYRAISADEARATGELTESPVLVEQAPYDVTGGIIAYESGELDHEQTVELFQHLIDTRMINHLQGSYGRTAQALLDAGEVIAR